MKKYLAILCTLLVLSLTACRQKEEQKTEAELPPAPSAEEEGALQIDILEVEISRGNLTSEQLLSAVKELPKLLQTYLTAEETVQIADIRVTVGDSSAVTARALSAGDIDLAFLSTEGFLEAGGESLALYGAAEKKEDSLRVGIRSLICAAPTEYGRQLDERAGSGKPLSWKEISCARWGVLGESSLAGYRSLDLWLAEQYEGARIKDLPNVTVFGSEEALLRAAAAGIVDAIIIRDDGREDMEDTWLRNIGQTGTENLAGLGRKEPIWQELPVLDVTERFCGNVVAVAPGKAALTDSRFCDALAMALKEILNERADLASALGAKQFVPIEAEALDSMARLMQMEQDD